jgi:glucosylceramidase
VDFVARAMQLVQTSWGNHSLTTNTTTSSDSNRSSNHQNAASTTTSKTSVLSSLVNSVADLLLGSANPSPNFPANEDEWRRMELEWTDGNLLLVASPWSPPSWMKQPTWEDWRAYNESRRDYDHSGPRPRRPLHAAKMTYSTEPTCLRDGVGPHSKYARAWAIYLVKFLQAFYALLRHHTPDSLPIWAITVQNEPEFPAPWEACAFSPQMQADFIQNHLGPVLRQAWPTTRLLAFDHNKDHINKWFDVLHNGTHTRAGEYIHGLAYHWYAGGMQRLLDGALGTANLHALQDRLQAHGLAAKHLVLGTESCHCPTTGYAGATGQETLVARAERYAHTILADLAAGSHGWLEWNLLLDGIGGPNHLHNLCEATILAVPHRAAGMIPGELPPLPPFESDRPLGNVSIGEGRTREELNAMGIKAEYLDVGLVVQPLYYYMGHISRYVRRGSFAARAIVDSMGSNQPDLQNLTVSGIGGRQFRQHGSTVSGGGMNNLAMEGIELTLWPCEGSTRQQFDLPLMSEHNNMIMVHGHDWLGAPTKSCIGRTVDVDLKGLRLGACTEESAGIFELVPIESPSALSEANDTTTSASPAASLQRFHIRMSNPASSAPFHSCLAIRELGNGGGTNTPRGGAQLTVKSCFADRNRTGITPGTAWQVDIGAGEISSTYFGSDQSPVCLTTGWPFLQVGAFYTPTNTVADKTVVVLNEANDPANYILVDESENSQQDVILTASIPPRSIQTVMFDA